MRYGDKGWIKLWRSEMNTDLYREEPFTKWQALMDLRMMADDQGSVQTSLKALKNRWLWGSEHKVRDFLGSVSGSVLGSVTYIPNKGTLICINTEDSENKRKLKKGKQGSVSGSVSGIEELTSKEVVGASFRKNPTTIEKEKNRFDRYEELMREEDE